MSARSYSPLRRSAARPRGRAGRRRAAHVRRAVRRRAALAALLPAAAPRSERAQRRADRVRRSLSVRGGAARELAARHAAALPPAHRPAALEELAPRRAIAAIVHDGEAGGSASTCAACSLRSAARAASPPAAAARASAAHVGDALHLGQHRRSPSASTSRAGQLLGEAEVLNGCFGAELDARAVARCPPHHIYGLLFGLLLPLRAGAAFVRETPLHAEAMLPARRAPRGRYVRRRARAPAGPARPWRAPSSPGCGACSRRARRSRPRPRRAFAAARAVGDRGARLDRDRRHRATAAAPTIRSSAVPGRARARRRRRRAAAATRRGSRPSCRSRTRAEDRIELLRRRALRCISGAPTTWSRSAARACRSPRSSSACCARCRASPTPRVARVSRPRRARARRSWLRGRRRPAGTRRSMRGALAAWLEPVALPAALPASSPRSRARPPASCGATRCSRCSSSREASDVEWRPRSRDGDRLRVEPARAGRARVLPRPLRRLAGAAGRGAARR